MSPVKIIRKKLGELLIERKVITAKQLNFALRKQKLMGGYLSQHLISEGFATELDIATCLSSQYGFPYLPLKNYNIPKEILGLVPFKYIKIYYLLPVDLVAQTLTVVMADPLNDGVIEMLRQVTKYDIEVFISTYSEIEEEIRKYFANRLKEDSKDEVSEDLAKQELSRQHIQTLGAQGEERRTSLRLNVEKDMDYFVGGKSYKVKTSNLSLFGVLFISQSALDIDSTISCKINLPDGPLEAVVQVVRVERVKKVCEEEGRQVGYWHYGVSGSFIFMTKDHKKRLFAFLKEKQGSDNSNQASD